MVAYTHISEITYYFTYKLQIVFYRDYVLYLPRKIIFALQLDKS